MQLIQF